MKKKMPIIALAQIRYSGEDNLGKIKKYIKLAKKNKADIICFPESCVSKFEYLSVDDELIKEIQEACRKNSIWAIITDCFVFKEETYKTALLINRKGEIKGNYKKINLYDDDTKEGKKIFVYRTDFAKIGIVICWDLAFPDLFKKMKKEGAEIIFCPAHWCYENKEYKNDHKNKELILLKSMLMSRAFENLNFVALCNPLLNRKDLISYSAISSPHEILAEIKDKEGMITAKLNLNETKKFSRIYPGKGKW
jgi:predicted amidohydrolase